VEFFVLALVAELVDARDLKSLPTQVGCRFNSCRGHELKTRGDRGFFYFSGRKIIFMPEQWSNFFVMVGSGAAAHAGLIFVAMSINHEVIFRNTTHKNRAINMLSGFTAIFMASGLALIGNQDLGMLGFEWLVLWLIATVIFIRGYVVALRSGMSFIGLNTPRLAGGTICYLAEVIGAIFLILGYRSGFYIAAVAIIVLFAFLISGAWLLMIGIYEDRAK
jgi:hypothetical protein